LVFEAQGERHPQSTTRGRAQTPAENALRLLLLKHVRNWSFDALEREVVANLVYRDFSRIGLGKVPDAKTLARIAQALGGDVIAKLHERLVAMAQEQGVIRGRKMRVDTTVVETNIHYPTDSNWLGDGARVLTRGMKKIETKAGKLKRKVRGPYAHREQAGDHHRYREPPQRRNWGTETPEGISRPAAADAADLERHQARAGGDRIAAPARIAGVA
jgi:hypothetical protein